MWHDTFVVVTSDHGEQLGDQGLLGKGGMFEASYNIVGIVRDPRRPDQHGAVVDGFTENVDLFPTICEAMGLEVPSQCDGLPLTSFSKEHNLPGGATPRTGSTTGVGSTSRSGRIHGRGTAGSRPSI